MSERRPASGWQQPAVLRPRTQVACHHLGAAFASLAAGMHTEGHRWVCTCGQVFVVVSNGGRDKRLVKDWRPRATDDAASAGGAS